jgi:hypothetical protein
VEERKKGRKEEKEKKGRRKEKEERENIFEHYFKF